MRKHSGAVAPRHLARGSVIIALGFLALLLLLSVLEQVGVSGTRIRYLLVLTAAALMLAVGLRARTTEAAEFFVAGRRVPAVFNGMACAAEWLGAAVVLGFAAAVATSPAAAQAILVGLAGGYLLLAILIAPYLRKSGAYTVPDFLALRFGSLVRVPAAAVLVCCSFPLLVLNIQIVGGIVSPYLGLDADLAGMVGLCLVLVATVLGGMRAVTWTQAVQFLLLACALVLPVVLVAAMRNGLVPDLSGGWVAAALEPDPAEAAPAAPLIQGSWEIAVAVALGTAAMPHLCMRFLTSRSVRGARLSVAWSLLFTTVPLLAAGAAAAFLALAVNTDLIGAPVDALPAWFYAGGQTGLVNVCGVPAVAPEVVRLACEVVGNVEGLLGLEDMVAAPGSELFLLPSAAGLPAALEALVIAGVLGGALAGATGLTLAIGNSLGHDLFFRLLNRTAPAGRRLLVARLLLVGTAIAAGSQTGGPQSGLLDVILWSSALCAAALFPVLVLAVWWPRCTAVGALAGMGAGAAVVLSILFATSDSGLWPLPDSGSLGAASWAAIVGAATGFLVAVGGSLGSQPPSPDSLAVVEELRRPAGEPLLGEGPA